MISAIPQGHAAMQHPLNPQFCRVILLAGGSAVRVRGDSIGALITNGIRVGSVTRRARSAGTQVRCLRTAPIELQVVIDAEDHSRRKG
jgi:hypothetical protein